VDSAPAQTKQTEERKPGRNEFKCFNCRTIFSNKDGDWYAWNSMEVHLCNPCDKLTKNKAERKSD
jgi:hypothetical protein